jgi:hypothetical protein
MITSLLRNALAVVLTGAIFAYVLAQEFTRNENDDRFDWTDTDDHEFKRFVEEVREAGW